MSRAVGSGVSVVVLLSIVACAACTGARQGSGDGGAQDAPAGIDAVSDAPASSDVYICGSASVPCYAVFVGGDAGSILPDPGIIFVETEVDTIVADPPRNVIYAARWTGLVQAISTETGARLWQMVGPQGFPLERLAVTDDGSKIYSTGDHSSRIVRFDVSSRVADLIIAVPDAGVLEIQDVATIPGAPRSVLVAAANRLVVFDDDVPRPDQVTMSDQTSRLRFDGPTTAYRLDSGGGLSTLTVTSSGVQSGATPPVTGLFMPGDIELLLDGELAFGYDGHVVDPRAGTLLGMYGPGPVAVDRGANRAYVAPQPEFTVWQIIVDEYDRTAFTRLRTLKLSMPLRGSVTDDLVRTANGTLAFHGSIFLHEYYSGIVLVRPDAWNTAVAP